ncbi:MAG: AAA family ATPase, partial [Deltaproteobacteria bacterium]|nr:AAA family ATPase [Deltaproteobacteria bacterium]
MKNLPTGIADFEEVIKENYVYADKTKLLYQLLQHNKPYFLSRPRRFGKTLLLSTLEAILKGRRELFKGLWIEDSDYDWKPNPVIHLSLYGVNTETIEELEDDLIFNLNSVAKRENISLQGNTPNQVF